MGRLVWIVIGVAGCGRIGFDQIGGGDGGVVANTCPANAILCDDFETGDTSRWTFTNSDGTGSLSVDTVHARSGTHGLDAIVDPAAVSGNGQHLVLDIGVTTTGTIAVREWIYVEQPLADFDVVLQLRTVGLDHFVTAAVDSANTWVSSDFSNSSGLDDHHSTTPGPSIDTWTCVELEMTLAPSPQIHLFVNDVVAVAVAPGDPAPQYAQIDIGAPRADLPGSHIFTDDVVIARAHVGCL